jgi:ABC-type dipeptide/oligopeptide/nickel transport system ATPase component
VAQPETARPDASGHDAAAFLEVAGLEVHLPTGPRREIQAVQSVSLRVHRGERVGIVGESGSGKSVTGRAIAGLLPTNPRVRVSGSIRFDGREMVGAPPRAWDEIRSRSVGMIFQDPLTFLSPVMKVGAQVREAIAPGQRSGRDAAADPEAIRYLQLAGLADAGDLARRFPHELSGGQRQRVLIAIAIAKRPDLIIADEPTTALDATVQRKVLNTLDETVSTLGTSLILISHDLAVVASMTDTIYVMYAGRVVESGPSRQVLTSPQHPYTQALLQSVRSLTDDGVDLWSITPELRREIDALVQDGANA